MNILSIPNYDWTMDSRLHQVLTCFDLKMNNGTLNGRFRHLFKPRIAQNTSLSTTVYFQHSFNNYGNGLKYTYLYNNVTIYFGSELLLSDLYKILVQTRLIYFAYMFSYASIYNKLFMKSNLLRLT